MMLSLALVRSLGLGLLLGVISPAQGQQNQPASPAKPPASQSSSGATQESTPATPPSTSITQEPTSDQEGMFVFKKQVEEVVLHATVMDDKRHLETHLDRSAFTVFEDGHPQTITAFRRDDVPVAIGIVIDNSSSMRDKRDEVNKAVLNLIRASNPQDEVFVVNFSQDVYLDQDFTSDINLLERALRQSSTRGSTALYDAILASAVHLKNNAKLNKRLLLVITDGQDNVSQSTLQEVKRSLGESNGPSLYAIGLMGLGPQNRGWDALQTLSDATGGTAFFPQNLDDVSSITKTLAHDIRLQYTISYKPQNQNMNGTYHPIVVEARSNGYGRLIVHTRNGYYTGEAVR